MALPMLTTIRRRNPAAIRWTPYMFGGLVGQVSNSPIGYGVHEGPPRLEVVQHGPKCEAQAEYSAMDGKCSCPGVLYGPFDSVYELMRYAEHMNQGEAKYLAPVPVIKKTSGYR